MLYMALYRMSRTKSQVMPPYLLQPVPHRYNIAFWYVLQMADNRKDDASLTLTEAAVPDFPHALISALHIPHNQQHFLT